MPTLYYPDQLLRGEIPEIPALHMAPLQISEVLHHMYQAGEIVGATSYGSLFMEGAHLTCASDVDWLVIFTDHRAMLECTPWRALLESLDRMHVGFHGPVLTKAMVESGNHTLSSLLHGIRRSSKRLITGHDPLLMFEEAGAKQNAVLPTLQLFGSFPRFFFESYAYRHDRVMTAKVLVDLFNDAVSMWKDVLSAQLVRLVPPDATIPVIWSVYEQLYKAKISPEAMAAGARIEAFLSMYVLTMREYDLLRRKGTAMEDFALDYQVFLEESRHILFDAAQFVEANILQFRHTQFVHPHALHPQESAVEYATI
ncbi:hypothetical protein COW46_01700 [Candidatus Gracilibacteria bacterium CG17_big_fil_post_rev_8_21_14_2_50_48_13]|nr:MAG: hypothetical protein COW46_01700 [Candidatus Gracilibacteria bacterium CG17_big_fil_post_rev_8_21_14_2_50_48_13]